MKDELDELNLVFDELDEFKDDLMDKFNELKDELEKLNCKFGELDKLQDLMR